MLLKTKVKSEKLGGFEEEWNRPRRGALSRIGFGPLLSHWAVSRLLPSNPGKSGTKESLPGLSRTGKEGNVVS